MSVSILVYMYINVIYLITHKLIKGTNNLEDKPQTSDIRVSIGESEVEFDHVCLFC